MVPLGYGSMTALTPTFVPRPESFLPVRHVCPILVCFEGVRSPFASSLGTLGSDVITDKWQLWRLENVKNSYVSTGL